MAMNTQPLAIQVLPPVVGAVAAGTTYRVIPTEIWVEIARYISRRPERTLGNLRVAGHSRPARELRGRIYWSTIAQISGNPIAQLLMGKMNLPRGKSAEEQVRVLDACLRYANSVSRVHYLWPEYLEQGLLAGRSEEFDEVSFLRNPRNLIDQYSALPLGRVFMYLVRKCNPALFDLVNVVPEIEILNAAILSLWYEHIDQFKNLLVHTTLDGYELNQLLCFSIYKKRMDIFDQLMNLNKPFNHDQVLVDAARMDSEEGINKLLQSKLVFYDEPLIFDRPGLALALQVAAERNNRAALHAILNAKPGPTISRRILVEVRDLLRNDGSGEENLDHASIADLLDREISRRYPPPADPVVLAGVPAPAAPVDAVALADLLPPAAPADVEVADAGVLAATIRMMDLAAIIRRIDVTTVLDVFRVATVIWLMYAFTSSLLTYP